MALKLELPEQPNGFSFLEAYVKAYAGEINSLSKTATIDTYFYKDEAARLAGREPMAMAFSTRFFVRDKDYDAVFAPGAQPNSSGPQELLYIALKRLPFFNGAVDC